MGFADLPTLAELQQTRRAVPKHEIKPAVIAREERKKAKADKGEAFRDAVWKRDKSLNRATGELLKRVHPKRGASLVPWNELGEVDHAYERSTHPDRIYDPHNGILLSKELNRLRKVPCSRAPEHRRFEYSGPEDRGKPQTFIWRDDDGKITRRTKG